MPKKITNDPVWNDTLEVPRDGEGIDAADVELPVGDLLGNTRYLLKLVNNLQTEVEDLKRSRGGYTVNTQAGVTIEPGKTQQLTILIGRYDGFTDPVNLAVDGLPGGVTAALGENPVTGASTTLTLTATVDAAPGVFTLLLTGTSGTRTAQGRTQLTVTPASLPASFDLSVPASVSYDRNALFPSATIPVNIERTGGFTEHVTLSGVNLPAGVTLTWGTPDGTNKTALGTVNVSAAVPAGTYNLQVRGVAGSKVVTKALSLVVTVAPQAEGDFQLSIAYDAGNQSATNGGTVSITRTGGFTGDVWIKPIQGSVTFVSQDPYNPYMTMSANMPAPVLNVNGQTGNITTAANTVRVTANGAATGWLNSGVADPISQFPEYVMGKHQIALEVEAFATINGKTVTRRLPVMVRVGVRAT